MNIPKGCLPMTEAWRIAVQRGEAAGVAARPALTRGSLANEPAKTSPGGSAVKSYLKETPDGYTTTGVPILTRL